MKNLNSGEMEDFSVAQWAITLLWRTRFDLSRLESFYTALFVLPISDEDFYLITRAFLNIRTFSHRNYFEVERKSPSNLDLERSIQ